MWGHLQGRNQGRTHGLWLTMPRLVSPWSSINDVTHILRFFLFHMYSSIFSMYSTLLFSMRRSLIPFLHDIMSIFEKCSKSLHAKLFIKLLHFIKNVKAISCNLTCTEIDFYDRYQNKSNTKYFRITCHIFYLTFPSKIRLSNLWRGIKGES